ncbi:peptide chain release factor family protein [Aspergillus tanneri]|uniref:Prokaryotic-type class I peptide chain release factors domain-containing protein n=1 Tax=Aspergillus tanneri TaxID=1220188 RepID=A0A5M9MFK2_9EURO|nr:uncharacterized protein ATNIH1004_010046 [Aspergillus tanneri]KAA8643279.1 hypothetical protein ATNIH1004_010046 [Aspergillus tanneri]
MLQSISFSRVLSACTGTLVPGRFFSISASSRGPKSLPSRIKIEHADLTVSYVKGTGPGGQKINKTNSAAQLIHKPSGLVVKSQATRSRSQNEKIARHILADRIEQLQKGDQSRLAIKADKARKKKASKMKKSRRKYRELADNLETQGRNGYDREGKPTQGQSDGKEVSQDHPKTARLSP